MLETRRYLRVARVEEAVHVGRDASTPRYTEARRESGTHAHTERERERGVWGGSAADRSHLAFLCTTYG